MGEQELFTDLAIAERNTKGKHHLDKVYFAEAVRDAFRKTQVDTYYDLIHSDLKLALQLRTIAKNAKLI